MKIILTILIAVAPHLAAAEAIRLGAWNIQDLHHEEGHHLRLLGIPTVQRETSDFDMLAKYRDRFGKDATPADVIALQEIGTKAALERLFPEDQYDTYMSARWVTDDAAPGEGDVFTAIAIHKDSGVSVLERDDLEQLAMMGEDGRFTRSGTALLLKFDDLAFWFLSVHLKSGCPKTQSIHVSTSAACETLWLQSLILREWVAKKREQAPVVIAGDFNRHFRSLNDRFGLWKSINGVGPTDEITEQLFVAHPITATRKCLTKKGNSLQPIDWFLVDIAIADRVLTDSYWETRWPLEDVEATQNGRGLSDHCPISVDLKTE